LCPRRGTEPAVTSGPVAELTCLGGSIRPMATKPCITSPRKEIHISRCEHKCCLHPKNPQIPAERGWVCPRFPAHHAVPSGARSSEGGFRFANRGSHFQYRFKASSTLTSLKLKKNKTIKPPPLIQRVGFFLRETNAFRKESFPK